MSTFTKRMRMSNGQTAIPAAPSGAEDHDVRTDDGVHRTGATFAVPGTAPWAVVAILHYLSTCRSTELFAGLNAL